MENADIVKHVRENLLGRIASKIGDRETGNTEILLEFVRKSKEGNHLEIGTLFGGSAIAVAILKRVLGQYGIVICIDPLDGYYRKYAPRPDMVDTQSGVAVTPKTLFENIDKLDVGNRIAVMKMYSTECIPFDITFSTAYIDGDHRDGVPLKDWLLVKDVVTDFVIFDNCADTHPSVQEACTAASQDSEWECVYNKDITYVVKRIG